MKKRNVTKLELAHFPMAENQYNASDYISWCTQEVERTRLKDNGVYWKLFSEEHNGKLWCRVEDWSAL